MQVDAQTKDKHILVSLYTVKNSDFYNHLLSEYNQGNPPNPQIPIGVVCKREGCVMGIEPNEHPIPRFQGKYSYHTDHSENPERPNSSNVLPMSRVMLGCGILRSCESQGFSWDLERTVGLRWRPSELL